MNTKYLAVVACFALAPVALADEFSFSFSGGGITSSGTFTVTPTATPGLDHVTGITGTFADTNDGISGAITGIYTPLSYSVPPATVAYTSNNVLSYDDTFWPGGNSPADCPGYPFHGGDFDVYGVAFTVAGGYVAGVWSDGNIPGHGQIYAAGDGNSTTVLDIPNPNGDIKGEPVGVPVSFIANAVPEPGSLFLLVVGSLAGLAWFGIKSRL